MRLTKQLYFKASLFLYNFSSQLSLFLKGRLPILMWTSPSMVNSRLNFSASTHQHNLIDLKEESPEGIQCVEGQTCLTNTSFRECL